MDWTAVFTEIGRGGEDIVVEFLPPISTSQVQTIEKTTGIALQGPLLELLQQTNGIRNKRFGDFLVWNDEEIVAQHLNHIEFLKEAELTAKGEYLFFADDGCGEHFGFAAAGGEIKSEEVGIYYPMENRFAIVAQNLYAWAVEWYAGTLAV